MHFAWGRGANTHTEYNSARQCKVLLISMEGLHGRWKKVVWPLGVGGWHLRHTSRDVPPTRCHPPVVSQGSNELPAPSRTGRATLWSHTRSLQGVASPSWRWRKVFWSYAGRLHVVASTAKTTSLATSLRSATSPFSVGGPSELCQVAPRKLFLQLATEATSWSGFNLLLSGGRVQAAGVTTPNPAPGTFAPLALPQIHHWIVLAPFPVKLNRTDGV